MHRSEVTKVSSLNFFNPQIEIKCNKKPWKENKIKGRSFGRLKK